MRCSQTQRQRWMSLVACEADADADSNGHLELLSNNVGFRVARFAGGWLVHMDLLEQGPHEVQRTHCGVLKQGEGLQEKASTRSQHSQCCHHFAVVQRGCAHFLQATIASAQLISADVSNQATLAMMCHSNIQMPTTNLSACISSISCIAWSGKSHTCSLGFS